MFVVRDSSWARPANGADVVEGDRLPWWISSKWPRAKSTAVAGAIAWVVRENGRAEVQAIGAGAVNQAAKAVAIARGYLALDGIDAICIPTFADVMIADQERTALRFIVEPR